MSTRKKNVDLGLLVRRQGAPQTPVVDAAVGEVRTCINARWIPNWGKSLEDSLGAIVVLWDYALPLTDVDQFHKFLRENELFIQSSSRKVMASEAYRGTYMEFGYGNPRYRTIWTYRSIDAIDKWSAALKDPGTPFYKAMLQLRAFWLRDPMRSEARWAPARFYFNPDSDELADSIAKLTVAAARLNQAGGQMSSPQSGKRSPK